MCVFCVCVCVCVVESVDWLDFEIGSLSICEEFVDEKSHTLFLTLYPFPANVSSSHSPTLLPTSPFSYHLNFIHSFNTIE